MNDNQDDAVRSWLARLEPRTRADAEEAARLVAGVDQRLHRAVKWGRLTFAVEGNWHHWLCGIAVTKSASSLVFHKGVLLDDPEHLLKGTGRYVRQLPLDAVNVRADAVVQLVRSAIRHETALLD